MRRWERAPAWTPQVSGHIPAVVEMARAQEGDGARLFLVERVDWPDSCIGIYRDRPTICFTVVTPGYLVLVERNGWLVEYHTDRESRVIRAGFAGKIQADGSRPPTPIPTPD